MPILTDNTGKRRPESSAWYLALIAILLTVLVVWVIFSIRVDLFTEALKREEAVGVLLMVDDGEKPVLTTAFFYHPVTHNGALVAIPRETGALLPSLDRVDRLEVLYNFADWNPYKTSVGRLLGQPIDFFLRLSLDDFEKLIDLMDGVDIFIPTAVDDTLDGVRYLFPPGGVRHDGAKARSYVMYRPVGISVAKRTENEHRIMQSLIRQMGNRNEWLQSDEVFPFVGQLIQSDFGERGLKSFFNAVSTVDAERLILQGILGNRRTLDGKEVLFPFYDANLVKETVESIRQTLAQNLEFGDESLTIQVEILNGTKVNGLAARTAQIYRSYGFRVATVGNADRDDYERTVVLDRRGNPDAARRIAELIRSEQIHSEIEENRDETVDVTIILGQDFDGRYVK